MTTSLQDQYGQTSFTSFRLSCKVRSALTPTLLALSLRSTGAPLKVPSLSEDSIKLLPSLELRLGFRGEFTNGWNEANGRASNFVVDANGLMQHHPAVGTSASHHK